MGAARRATSMPAPSVRRIRDSSRSRDDADDLQIRLAIEQSAEKPDAPSQPWFRRGQPKAPPHFSKATSVTMCSTAWRGARVRQIGDVGGKRLQKKGAKRGYQAGVASGERSARRARKRFDGAIPPPDRGIESSRETARRRPGKRLGMARAQLGHRSRLRLREVLGT